jgi:outer membrane protein assembly factor BamA
MRVGWVFCTVFCTLLAAVALVGAQSGNQLVAVKPPVVRTVEFKNFRGITAKEIVTRLNDKDIQLVERPYNPEYVETAQGIVEEFLKEKGQNGIHVKPTVTRIPPNSVRVTFTAAP